MAQEDDSEDTNDDSVNEIQRRVVDKNLRQVNERLLKVPDTLKNLRRANALTERKLMKKTEATELKEKLTECRSSEEQDCKDLKKEARLRIKTSLQRITEMMLNVLNKLKDRIEDSDAENKDSILEEINVAIADIENAKQGIMGLDRDSTREEIKAAISELKDALKEARELVRKYYAKGKINEQRLQNAINKFEKLAENIEDRLNKFEERGYDFGDLKELLQDLKQETKDAQTELDNGNNEGALEHLRNAHQIVINILKEFRANKPRDTEDEDTEDEEDDNESNETGDDDDEDEEDEEEDDEDEDEGNETDDGDDDDE